MHHTRKYLKAKGINQKMEETKTESKRMKVKSKDMKMESKDGRVEDLKIEESINQKIEVPKDEKSKDVGLKIGQKMKLNQNMMEFLDGKTFDSTEQGMKKFIQYVLDIEKVRQQSKDGERAKCIFQGAVI